MEYEYKTCKDLEDSLNSNYSSDIYNREDKKKIHVNIPELNILCKFKGKDYNKQDDDLLEEMSNELHALKKGSLGQIINMIDERVKERDRNLYEIDKGICDLHTKQFELDIPYSDICTRVKASLEQAASKLEMTKSQERVSAWKDITRLRQDLMPVLNEYLSSLRKMKVIGGSEKDQDAEEEEIYKEKRRLPIFPTRIP
jgi:hypothetical protein